MNFYNQVLDKKGLKRIVSWFIENYGPTRTNLLLDDFKYIGFHYAGRAGLSLGFDDLRIPSTKKLLLEEAQKQVQMCEKTYGMGRITAFERYQRLIDIWTTTSEKLKDEVIQNFQKIQGGPLASPLYMMAFSGARGNISQVRQLVGMRGLMSDSGGGIIDFPIRSNFREGLSVTEYVISCYGARKGLIDTALRTADSGYLTRRLVDVAHGILIREIDCGTSESISIKTADTKNLIGRVLAETVSREVPPRAGFPPPKFPEPFRPFAWKNQEISPTLALELKTSGKSQTQVRSPLTCLSQSVCQLCYGWNLAQGRLVSLGDAVGILAAQSIGEPGTQLTMRTFHTGGIFSTEVEDKIFPPHNGKILIANTLSLNFQSPFLGEQIGQPRGVHEQSFQTASGAKPARGAKPAGGGGDPARPREVRNSQSGGGGSPPPGSLTKKGGAAQDSPPAPPSAKLQNTILNQRNFAIKGCKIRSVHGQTGFFFFEAIQIKIQKNESKELLELPGQGVGLRLRALDNEEGGVRPRRASPPRTLQNPGGPVPNSLFSIIQLPPQSILFVSAGKSLSKNTLCAEISRIKPEVAKFGGAGFPPPSSREGGSKTPFPSSPPLLAQKKVFSEIQGEVVGGSWGPKAAPRQKNDSPHLLVLAGEPFCFKRASQLRGQSRRGGESRPNFLQRHSDAKPPKREEQRGAGIGNFRGSAPGGGIRPPRERPALLFHPPRFSPPLRGFAGINPLRPRYGNPSKMTANSKGSILERTAEPPTLDRKRIMNSGREGIVDDGNFLSSQGKDNGSFYSHNPASSLSNFSDFPFQSGDIVFWKGKRQSINQALSEVAGALEWGGRFSPKGLRPTFKTSGGGGEFERSSRPSKPTHGAFGRPALESRLKRTASSEAGFAGRGSPPPEPQLPSRGSLLPKALVGVQPPRGPSAAASLQGGLPTLTGFDSHHARPSGGFAEIEPKVSLLAFEIRRISGRLRPPGGEEDHRSKDSQKSPSEERTKGVGSQETLPSPASSTGFAPGGPTSQAPKKEEFSGLLLEFHQQKKGWCAPRALGPGEVESRNSRSWGRDASREAAVKGGGGLRPDSSTPTGSGDQSGGRRASPPRSSDSRPPSPPRPAELPSIAPLGEILQPNTPLNNKETLNVPTQVIRKRFTRLILRRAQPHLGAQIVEQPVGGSSSASLVDGGGKEVGESKSSIPPPRKGDFELEPPSDSRLPSAANGADFPIPFGHFIQQSEPKGVVDSAPSGGAEGRENFASPPPGAKPPDEMVGRGGAHKGFYDEKLSKAQPAPMWPLDALELQTACESELTREAKKTSPTFSGISGFVPQHSSLPKAMSSRYVKERDLLFQLILPISQSSSSGDIVQGLPKIEQLFEARGGGGDAPRGVKGSTNLVGAPPSRLLANESAQKSDLRDLQKRLIQEIQSVYNSQGVEIADKHLEIIVRQMTSRVKILEKAKTPFFPEDIIEYREESFRLSMTSPPTPGLEELQGWGIGGEEGRPAPGGKGSCGSGGGEPRPAGFAPAGGEADPDSKLPGFPPKTATPAEPQPFPGRNPPGYTSFPASAGRSRGGEPRPAYEWILLGITKVALLSTTESYISAASFQETKRVLMNSALQSRVDFFEGLKENVIVGRIIPAGTGGISHAEGGKVVEIGGWSSMVDNRTV